jgi:hypothetical protein
MKMNKEHFEESLESINELLEEFNDKATELQNLFEDNWVDCPENSEMDLFEIDVDAVRGDLREIAVQIIFEFGNMFK